MKYICLGFIVWNVISFTRKYRKRGEEWEKRTVSKQNHICISFNRFYQIEKNWKFAYDLDKTQRYSPTEPTALTEPRIFSNYNAFVWSEFPIFFHCGVQNHIFASTRSSTAVFDLIGFNYLCFICFFSRSSAYNTLKNFHRFTKVTFIHWELFKE